MANENYIFIIMLLLVIMLLFALIIFETYLIFQIAKEKKYGIEMWELAEIKDKYFICTDKKHKNHAFVWEELKGITEVVFDSDINVCQVKVRDTYKTNIYGSKSRYKISEIHLPDDEAGYDIYAILREKVRCVEL